MVAIQELWSEAWHPWAWRQALSSSHFDCNLLQVSSKDGQGSPTAARAGGSSHSFEEAKEHVDKDLQLFLDDVQELYDRISERSGADVDILLEVVEK